jgi:hypothetical protein
MTKKTALPLDSEFEYEKKADGSIESEGDREDAHWKTVRCMSITTCVVACFPFGAAALINRHAWIAQNVRELSVAGCVVFLLGALATVAVAVNRK